MADTPSPITAESKKLLRELFEANGVKPKSKTALKYEFFLVQGLFTAVNQKIPPALVMMMLAGRSILDYEVAP